MCSLCWGSRLGYREEKGDDEGDRAPALVEEERTEARPPVCAPPTIGAGGGKTGAGGLEDPSPKDPAWPALLLTGPLDTPTPLSVGPAGSQGPEVSLGRWGSVEDRLRCKGTWGPRGGDALGLTGCPGPGLNQEGRDGCRAEEAR